MKHIKRLAVIVVFTLAVCGLAIAQVHRKGGLWHRAAAAHGDPASIAAHFSQVFPEVAAFDIDKDGKLGTTEKQALGAALDAGQLQLPTPSHHMPPHGADSTPEQMLNHIAEMYSHVAGYDANRDGTLDSSEAASIQNAIGEGRFTPHGMSH